MDDPNIESYDNMNQLVCGFAAPDADCGSKSEIESSPKMLKISNIALRWKIPSEVTEENAPRISPCFSVGKDFIHTNWRIHVFTNQREGETKMLSIFIEFFEHLDPTLKHNAVTAIYIVRLLDSEGGIVQSKRSGRREFAREKLSYGWKSYCPLSESLENLLESNQLRVEVDLSTIHFEPVACDIPVKSDPKNDELKGMRSEDPNHELKEMKSKSPNDELKEMNSETSTIGEIIKDPKPKKEEENIQWIDIMIDDRKIARGNKAKLIEKSNYFKDHLDINDTTQTSLTLSIFDDRAIHNLIDYINGDVDKCELLHSENIGDLYYLWTRAHSFKVPSLMYDCFNAMTKGLSDVEYAVILATWASNYELDHVAECEPGLAKVSSVLMKNIFALKTSPMMQHFKEQYGDWIVELLIRAK